MPWFVRFQLMRPLPLMTCHYTGSRELGRSGRSIQIEVPGVLQFIYRMILSDIWDVWYMIDDTWYIYIYVWLYDISFCDIWWMLWFDLMIWYIYHLHTHFYASIFSLFSMPGSSKTQAAFQAFPLFKQLVRFLGRICLWCWSTTSPMMSSVLWTRKVEEWGSHALGCVLAFGGLQKASNSSI